MNLLPGQHSTGVKVPAQDYLLRTCDTVYKLHSIDKRVVHERTRFCLTGYRYLCKDNRGCKIFPMRGEYPMRTDARIDRKQVRLPNASHLGFGKGRAQLGDWVTWKTDGNEGFGRVAGRVAYAPAICEDKEPIRGWLLVMAFFCENTTVGERWVNPEWVTRCTPANDHTLELWKFMQSDEFVYCPADQLRRWSETGYASVFDMAHQVSREHGHRSKESLNVEWTEHTQKWGMK